MIYKYFLVCFIVLFIHTTHAAVIVPSLFSDHMVLQQNTDITIWGWAKPNEIVRIIPSWDTTAKYELKVNNQSAWQMKIKTPSAGGPYEIVVQGDNFIKINDVLIGEVWLGSGQSNMEWSANSTIHNAKEEIKQAHFPQIRFFAVDVKAAHDPQLQCGGKWVVCTPETMQYFSAVLYFFGRELFHHIQHPIGLINSSWGGTPIEIWMSAPSIAEDRLLNENAKLLKPAPWGPHEPGRAYNSMIYPLAPYAIKGALWYQGESNTANANNYARALSRMIQHWRSLWGIDFSFYIAQIAPFEGYGKDNVNGAIVRDQQRKVLEIIPHTGMAVLSDIGDLKDIHPKNKQDVGKRLALWALHHDYNKNQIIPSGPLLKTYTLEKDKINIEMAYGEGMYAKDGELKELEVLTSSNKWVPSVGKLKKDCIQVEISEKIKGVRLGYKNDSNLNLYNAAGLPASCFEIRW